MNYSQEYERKLMEIDDVLSLFKSGDSIQGGFCANAPSGVFKRLHEIADRVERLNIISMLDNTDYPFYHMAELVGRWSVRGTFLTGPLRAAKKLGMVEYCPANMSNYVHKFRHTGEELDYFVVMVSPMDKHGYFHHSLAAVNERTFMSRSKKIIVQVNKHMPRVGGHTALHISQADYICEADHPVFTLPDIPVTAIETTIGGYVAQLINDNDTLQLGIGGIPNAVADSLKDKKGLGIHTEMLTSRMVDLFEAGVITNRNKQVFPGQFIATFAMGNQRLYDFIDQNPTVQLLDSEESVAPAAMSQNHNMVSVNTALQIDLTGQVCSESIGHHQYSGTGGASDTAEGATRSLNGRSIIALKSTAKDDSVSTIMPFLSPGAQVSVGRNTVDYVVTEYGIAEIRGQTVRNRAKNLISVAHPKFRDELNEQMQKYQIY